MPSSSPASLPARLASKNIAAHIKNLNGAKGHGDAFVSVRLDREFDEITITLFEGNAVRGSYYIDRGHTPAERLAAIDDLYATAARMLAL